MFSNIKIPDRFLSQTLSPVFLVDTDILSDICKGGLSSITEKELLKKKVTLLYSLTSIMELGFGPSQLRPETEENYYKELYDRKSALDRDIFVSDFHRAFKEGLLDTLKGNWIGVSPDAHNWYAAKKALISYMDAKGLTDIHAKRLTETAQKLQIDTVLSCAAWNAGAFVWSNNVKDHILAAYYMIQAVWPHKGKKDSKETLEFWAQHMSPIFDTMAINKMLSGERFNIYTEMIKRIKNKEILKVLEIAELQNV